MSSTPTSPAFFLLLAFFSLGLAGLVWFKARPGPVRSYFSLFAVAVAAWLASGFLLYSDIDPPRAVLWARLAFASAALSIPCFYHVLVLFPDQESAPFGQPINLAGVALALLSVLTPFFTRAVTSDGPFQIRVEYGPLFLPFGAYVVLVVALAVRTLVIRFGEVSGIRRLQIQYLLLGTAIPVAGVLITNLILPLVFKVSTFAPYGRLLAVVFLPVTAHAIIRHRLMDVRLLVRNAVVYACAVAASAGIFGGLLWLIGILSPASRGRSVQESILLAILIAVLFQPVKSAIEYAFNRYLYRERHDYPRILKESSQRLSTILDPLSAGNYLAELISGIFKADPVRVFLRDDSRDAFVLVNLSIHDEAEPLDPISIGAPLPSYLKKDGGVLVRDEIVGESDRRGHGAATNQLRGLGGDLAISFWHLGRLSGFLTVGAKLSGDPYYADDVDFLVTLGNQAAVAIENLELHRRMEEERLRAERLGAVGTLASGIAHEIKNPLVAIRTFAELLPERFNDEEFHGEFAKVVVKEIERIDGLVVRLRGLATQPVQRIAVLDIRAPIEETLALLRGQIEQKRIRVTTQYEGDIPLILGESDLLKQLFLNLFMNATEAIDVDGALSIRLWTTGTQENRSLVVEVSDTGPGIKDDMLDRIFDPFISAKPGGSGLGLAICRSIADAHGATIRARNNDVLRGATFTVEFRVGDRVVPARSEALHGLEGLPRMQATGRSSGQSE